MVYRIGIVGAGGIAWAHGKAIAKTDCAEIVAVCSRSQETVQKYCDEFDVRNGYTDLDKMLEKESLDSVIVCTWGCSHAEIGNRIATSQRVRAILCEKPITNTAAECEEMVVTAKANGVLLAEAFKFRHHPLHQKTRELIDAGKIGTLRNIRSTFCTGLPQQYRDPASNWRFNKEKGGGATYDLGCYNIHHARFIADSDPLRVYANSQDIAEVDDTVVATLVFPNHVTAQLTFSFEMAGSQYFEVSGTDGLIYAETAWNNENSETTLELRTREGNKTYSFEPVDPFQNQIEHLCECLDTGQAYRIAPENSIGNMKTIDAIYQSIRTGQVVALG